MSYSRSIKFITAKLHIVSVPGGRSGACWKALHEGLVARWSEFVRYGRGLENFREALRRLRAVAFTLGLEGSSSAENNTTNESLSLQFAKCLPLSNHQKIQRINICLASFLQLSGVATPSHVAVCE